MAFFSTPHNDKSLTACQSFAVVALATVLASLVIVGRDASIIRVSISTVRRGLASTSSRPAERKSTTANNIRNHTFFIAARPRGVGRLR